MTLGVPGRLPSLAGQEHGRTIPLADIERAYGHGIVRVIGVFIALVVSTNVTHTWYWRGAIFLGVLAVYLLTVWLLQLGWSR